MKIRYSMVGFLCIAFFLALVVHQPIVYAYENCDENALLTSQDTFIFGGLYFLSQEEQDRWWAEKNRQKQEQKLERERRQEECERRNAEELNLKAEQEEKAKREIEELKAKIQTILTVLEERFGIIISLNIAPTPTATLPRKPSNPNKAYAPQIPKADH